MRKGILSSKKRGKRITKEKQLGKLTGVENKNFRNLKGNCLLKKNFQNFRKW